MEVINGYRLLRPFSAAGAGSALWTFAEKDGEEYFLKQFLTPVYPVEGTRLREHMLARCEEYEKNKLALYNAINAADNGNIVTINEFFRHETKYYIATERVQESAITAEKAASLPVDKIEVLIKTLLHCLVQIERAGVIHADLKPSNIMLKPTRKGYYALKLIDFDSSFFVNDPPRDPEELLGDTVYLAPEMFLAMTGEEIALTSKVDVFATGLIIHEMFAGALPAFPEECDYAFEAALSGCELRIADAVPDKYRPLIADMLSVEPDMRPTFAEAFDRVSGRLASGEASGKMANPWLRPAGRL